MDAVRRTAGGICWILTALYVAVQPVVISAWRGDYDLSRNTISDLGVTECGVFTQLGGDRVPVCSPRHNLMNTTFITVGLLMVAGSLLTRRGWPRRRTIAVAIWALIATGVGAVLIGVAPTNEYLALHAIGSVLQIPGSVAPLLVGIGLWRSQRPIAAFSVLVGMIGTIATFLFLMGVYLGLGRGGMEHLGFDPLIVWLVVLGAAFATGRRLPGVRSTNTNSSI